MNRFEDELRAALRRQEPASDFTGRVLERITQLPAPQTQTREKLREKTDWRQRIAKFFQPPQLKWAMVGAMALLLVAAAIGVHRYREHQRAMAEMAEGQRAKEQVMLAMRIASQKLNVAQKKVQEAGERTPSNEPGERQ